VATELSLKPPRSEKHSMYVLGSFSSLSFSLFFRFLSSRCLVRLMVSVLSPVHCRSRIERLQSICVLSETSFLSRRRPPPLGGGVPLNWTLKLFTLPHNNTRDRDDGDGKRQAESTWAARTRMLTINWPLATIQTLACLKEARKVFSITSSRAAWRFPLPFLSDSNSSSTSRVAAGRNQPQRGGRGEKGQQSTMIILILKLRVATEDICQLWGPSFQSAVGFTSPFIWQSCSFLERKAEERSPLFL